MRLPALDKNALLVAGIYLGVTTVWIIGSDALVEMLAGGELDEIQRLQTPEEIERIARDAYGYTRPGEVAFVVLPGPPPELPGTWPYPLLAQVLQTRPS